MDKNKDRSEKFIATWEKHRKQKWMYAFVHGSLYWGLSTAVVSFLFMNNFDFQSMVLWRFVVYAIMFIIVGFGFGYFLFKSNESAFLDLTDGSMIRKGIQDLKSGLPWTYENINVSLGHNNMLNLSNILFWQNDTDNHSLNPDDCIQYIMEDYQKLLKNKYFRDFSSNKTLTVRVFDNSSGEKPIAERIIEAGKY